MRKISLLLSFYIFFVAVTIYTVFLCPEQRNKSLMENRTLLTKEIIKTDFSLDNLAKLVSDQFPLRDSLIKTNNTYEAFRSLTLGKIYDRLDLNILNKVGNYYRINTSDYYVENMFKADAEKETLFNNRLWNFEQIYNKYGNDYKLYIYKPDSAEEHNWFANLKEGEHNGEYFFNSLREHLSGKYSIESQNLKNIEQYMDEHYKTDHHWNYRGFYKGYSAIIEMIGKDFPISEPYPIEEVLRLNTPFYGSLSEKVDGLYGSEEFEVYRLANDDELICYVNGEKMPYGKRWSIFDDDIDSGDYLYEEFYGKNVQIVEYENLSLTDDAPSILVFVDSFSNPVKEDIARHFKHSYFVDPRYYVYAEDLFNTHFELDGFLLDHKVDAILWLQYYESLYFDSRMYMHINLDYENN